MPETTEETTKNLNTITDDDEQARMHFLRRKLSLSGCNLNLDGIAEEDAKEMEQDDSIHKNKHCINEYYGKSQRGYDRSGDVYL